MTSLVQSIRLMLVDDHAIVRAGLCALLRTFPRFEVVMETGDGREALECLDTCRPDVVMLDIAMPGLNGLEVAERMVKAHPAVRILILSMHANEEYVWRALQIGVRGFLLKDASAAEFERAVMAVAKGETFLCEKVARCITGDRLARSVGRLEPLQRLTPRQREILQLLAEGRNVKEIADLLQISPKTVETHRAQIMERLDITNLAGLVRYAMRTGVVSSE